MAPKKIVQLGKVICLVLSIIYAVSCTSMNGSVRYANIDWSSQLEFDEEVGDWSVSFEMQGERGNYILRNKMGNVTLNAKSGVLSSDVAGDKIRARRLMTSSPDESYLLVTEDVGETSPYSVYILFSNLDTLDPKVEYLKFPSQNYGNSIKEYEFPAVVKINNQGMLVLVYEAGAKTKQLAADLVPRLDFKEVEMWTGNAN